MNTNIDILYISDVEDFEIELVNPEFEQVYIKKKLFILPKYLFNNQNLLLEIT
jgi:hypothetical protein